MARARRFSPEAGPHLLVLGACLGLLLAAFALGHAASIGSSLRVGSVELPSICTMRNTFSIPCPGCGLTRSWALLARGDLRGSVQHHRLGWLIMLYVALQALRHGVWLAAPPWRISVERGGRWLDRGLLLLAAVLLLNWLLVLARL